MDREPSWMISLTAGTVLCTLAGFLLTALIAQTTVLRANPAAGYGQGDGLVVLRLMR